MGLETRILASRLGFRPEYELPRGWTEEKEKKEKEKFPLCVKA